VEPFGEVVVSAERDDLRHAIGGRCGRQPSNIRGRVAKERSGALHADGQMIAIRRKAADQNALEHRLSLSRRAIAVDAR
jgi:hypothetical protein